MASGRDEEDEARSPRVPAPDDRLWRHPSELARRRRRRTAWPFAALSGAAGASLALAAVAGVSLLRDSEPTTTADAAPSATDRPADEPPPPGDWMERIDAARDGVVSIRRIGEDVGGAGVLIRGGAYVVTNFHVLQGRAVALVELADGSRFSGRVIGVDPYTDLAVLATAARGLGELPIADSGELAAGDAVAALGSPFRVAGAPAVGVGTVTELVQHAHFGDDRSLYGMIGTTVPVGRTGSGGALLNHDAHLIGIITAMASPDDELLGWGMATPIDLAMQVADDIIDTGRARHVWLGIQYAENGEHGLLVTGVTPESPAATAGVASGDVITKINDTPVDSTSDLVMSLREERPGSLIGISWRRGPIELSNLVIAAERPDDVPSTDVSPDG